MIFARLVLALVTTTTMFLVTPARAQEEQALIVAMPQGFHLCFKHDRPDGSLKMTEFTRHGEGRP